MEFLYSESPSTGLVAGFGAGKSFIATIKTVKRMCELQCNVGYYLPTYPLIKDIAFSNFADILDKFQIEYKLNETDKVFKTDYGNIILRSMDNPTNIVGYETGYALIDEADILTQDKMQKAYKAIVARNRVNLGENIVNATDMVSTPEGYKFLYNYYVVNGSDRRALIKGNTLDNSHLPQSYIDNLFDTYPEEQLRAYMRGEFVNMNTGTVYREFDRAKHSTFEDINDGDILYIGMDFNIMHMSAVVCVKRGANIHAVDEIVEIYDTADMAKELNSKFPNHRKIVYPDASGGARSTSGLSDHNILKRAGLKVVNPKKNPPVRDRINTVNQRFNKGTLSINANKCPSLVEAVEKQSYTKDGTPDKSGGFDHVLDAFGYVVYNSEKTGAKIKSHGYF
jgi:hypothetical protein